VTGPVTAFAPGRVNLIGDHTDYAGGRCLPLPLDRGTTAVATPRPDRTLSAWSAAFSDEPVTATIDPSAVPVRTGRWHDLVRGVLWALARRGLLTAPGWDLRIDSTVPVGAGLSSSAALACAVATAVTAPGADRAALIAACIEAEHAVVGAPVGGMDQTVAVHGRAGHGLVLDFSRDAVHPIRPVPLPLHRLGARLLVIDTGERHRLADSAYPARRADTAAAARLCGGADLAAAGPPAQVLAVIGLRAAPADRDRLIRRARHVRTECARVDAVAALLRAAASGPEPAAPDVARAAALGALLTASHRSLATDFAVSTPLLDRVVAAALSAGAYGARLTGGGFGGAVLVLAPVDRADVVARAARRQIAAAGTDAAAVFTARTGPGAHRTAGPSA